MLLYTTNADVEAMKGKDKKALVYYEGKCVTSSKWFYEVFFPLEKLKASIIDIEKKNNIPQGKSKLVIIERVSQLNPIKYYKTSSGKIVGRYQP